MNDQPTAMASPRRRLAPLVATLLLAAAIVGPTAPASAQHRSWKYLTDKLLADDFRPSTVRRVFSDRRFPRFKRLPYSLEAKESKALYRNFLKPNSVRRAKSCRRKWAGHFERAQREYGVPASVLAAIVHVETQCGQLTGRHMILPRLARLAMANEPRNLQRNIDEHTKGLRGEKRRKAIRKSKERAKYLEDLFYPEVKATLILAKKLGIDPLAIKGSRSGAFGIPQFLPTSFQRFAVDANQNGRTSLFDPADAIASCANFLKGHGWRAGMDEADTRSVIWSYNRSAAYIDTVLGLSRKIAKAHPDRRN